MGNSIINILFNNDNNYTINNMVMKNIWVVLRCPIGRVKVGSQCKKQLLLLSVYGPISMGHFPFKQDISYSNAIEWYHLFVRTSQLFFE